MIRLGTLADIPAILDIGQTGIDQSVTDSSPVNKTKASAVLRKAVNHAHMELFVAEVDKVIVGFLVAIINDQWYNDDKYVTDLAFCTKPGHEDQAVWLFRRMLRWADSKGLPTLAALNAGGEKAERTGQMYEAHGMTRVGGVYFKGVRNEQNV